MRRASTLAPLLLVPFFAWGEEVDLDALGEQAVERLQAYIRVKTVNPPGDETRAVEFLGSILKSEGVGYETAESASGRGNLWARIEGGREPALVLLHHMDVVPADARHWTVDPFSAEIRDGYLYGRGALDTKGLGILHLQAFVALHRAGLRLNRDVLFLATADEEAGGSMGAGFLVEERPDLFRDVGLLLNEGGGGFVGPEGRQQFGIEITQKVPLWLRLVAVGPPGHGSVPRASSAVTRLLDALHAVQHHPFEPRLVPAVDAYFRGLAPLRAGIWSEHLSDMSRVLGDRDLMLRLQLEDPPLHALTRNTCSITMLAGSSKINVVPPEAQAELDCRLLPDQDPEAFLAELRTVINDPEVHIERIMGFTPAVSTTDSELYRAIERVLLRAYPEAVVLPTVSTGFTDSHFFRDLGIVSYGMSPMLLLLRDLDGVHANDERVPVEQVKRGTRLMYEIVREVTVDR